MNLVLPRRRFLQGVGSLLSVAALNSLLRAETATRASNPLAPRAPHRPAKAKACILLYMEGGPSHIDTFDPKPELDRRHMMPFSQKGKFVAAMDTGNRFLVKSPFKFRQTGQGGLWMCEHFEQLGRVADDLCIYRGCQVDSVDHPTANFRFSRFLSGKDSGRAGRLGG